MMHRARSPSGATQQQQHYHHDIQISDEEEHGMMEDEEVIEEEFIDEEDSGSSLSIPNESIDFDLVYAFHSFAATVEGQANVVKGDSLRLIDDSNSYWWLVNVLNTQDVGYIPAENIETPLERLARLNKHRNVDLTYPTQQEQQEDIRMTRERLRMAAGSRGGSATPQRQRPRVFVDDDRLTVHNYPPAIWNEEEYEEEDDDDMDYEEEDGDIHAREGINNSVEVLGPLAGHAMAESEDDGMEWEEGASEHQATVRPPQIVEPEPEQESRAAQQARIGLGQPSGALHTQTSRERLFAQQQAQAQSAQIGIQSSPMLDPAEVTETRRITATPDLVRDHGRTASLQRTISPESESQRVRADSPKRTREEEGVVDETGSNKRSKGKPVEQERQLTRSVSSESRLSGSSSGHGTNKLRKDREKAGDHEDEKERKEEKKKKGGVLSSLFGRRNKDKDKGKGDSPTSPDTIRPSEDSARSSSAHGHSSSTGALSTEGIMTPIQNQPQSAFSTPPRQLAVSQQELGRNSTDPRRQQTTPSNVSPHTWKLQQADQQRQAQYHAQHLNRGPGSPEHHVVPSYGLQSASEFLSSSSAANTSLKATQTPERQRPGSLLLSPSSNDKQGTPVPELTVIRVFAGDGMQTEATFKTVLLNGSTISQDLIKQAMQRFRLAGGEEADDYYLTIKQVDGPSAVLKPEERPLLVFEGLVEATRLPKLNRNSVGSISSLASNLSMHPAIQNLPMNDFTDDSAVKFYLNRRDTEGSATPSPQPQGAVARPPRSSSVGLSKPPLGAHGATIHPGSITPERFSSPGVRFAIQLVIHPEDVPDGMVFDPQTEAIIPKAALRERPQSIGSVTGISLAKRKKVLMFPKNTTVAEVIELGLERFGILEGVVDGGDDVEDKAVKRRSMSRVRYGLAMHIDGQAETMLAPSMKVIEAFPKPPIFKDVDRRSIEGKRRSADSSSLLGLVEDIQPGDPTFILRRGGGSRLSHRHSAPLDEIALHRIHRDSAQSNGSGSIRGEEAQLSGSIKSDSPNPQLSQKELIAAQRAASRANQRALLTANNNSERGVDLLLPDRAVIRSSHQQPGEKIRYSYVDPDGESYDISEIMENLSPEDVGADPGVDLVGGVLRHNSEQLDRILDKIKSTKKEEKQGGGLTTATSLNSMTNMTTSSSSQSMYSEETIRTPVDQPMGPIPRRVNSPTQQLLGERSRSPPITAERAMSPRLFGTRGMSPIQQVLSDRAKSPPHAMYPERVKSPIQHQLQQQESVRARSPVQPSTNNARAKSPVQGSTNVGRSSPIVHQPISRETTPISRYATPMENVTPSSRTATPTQIATRVVQNRSTTPNSASQRHLRQNSASSTQSEASQYALTPIDPAHKSDKTQTPKTQPRLHVPANIGFDQMWQIIEVNAQLQRRERPDPLDPVDEMLFGHTPDVDKLHPVVQKAFGPLFSEMERIEKMLDDKLSSLLSSNSEPRDNYL